MRLVHSYSALKLYEQCGLRYYRQRVLKDAKETDTAHITYGNTVHKAIEDKIKHAKPIPMELQPIDGLVSAVTKSAANAGSVLVVEQAMGVDRDYNPVDYWSGNVWIRSKIDLLAGSNKRNAVVIDWKTGKRKIDFTQLAISAISVFKSYANVDTIQASFVWLKDKTLDKMLYRREQLPALTKQLTPRLLAIEEANESNIWVPKPSHLCNWCPCKPTCPYSK